MKTSNKLLLGLLAFILLSLIGFNITIKNRIDKNPQLINTEMKSDNGVRIQSNSNETDSMALDSAISNE